MNNPEKVKKENLDFLWYLIFKIKHSVAKENPAEALKKCIESGYHDTCRTIRYFRSTNALNNSKNDLQGDQIAFQDNFKKNKENFIAAVNKKLFERINELLKDTEQCFDTWHHETCEEIIGISEEMNKVTLFRKDLPLLYYGQAQKWLNITLKNMLVMDLWTKKMDVIRSKLHVPVDNIVLDNAKTYYQLKIECDNKSWSRWNKAIYVDFQNNIRSLVRELNREDKATFDCPIDWEFDLWMKRKPSDTKNQE